MKSIYTDGACKGNPGPGGWGVFYEEENIEIYSSDPDTTNNKMELMAAIGGTKLVFENEEAKIYTDSQYVIKGLTEWMINWKKNGWKTAKKEPVKNAELWKELDIGIQNKKIEWIWVKGHNGDPGNTKADQLANKGASGNSNYHKLNDILKEIKGNCAVTPIRTSKIENKSIKLELGIVITNNTTKESFIVTELNLSVWNSEVKVHKIISLDNAEKSYLLTHQTINKDFNEIEVDTKMYQKCLYVIKGQPNVLKQLYNMFETNCPHIISEDRNNNAHCKICRHSFGHYCPDSPDNVCHYYTNSENMIQLLIGEEVKPPKDHNKNYESDDYCIYCHSPEERK